MGQSLRVESYLLAGLLLCLAATQVTAAASRLSQIKSQGVVRCGSVVRPGIASVDGNGRWRGLAVDVCRAVATAVLNMPERMEYHEYQAPAEFDRVRNQVDDLSFLTGRELSMSKLLGAIVPGPTVFVASDALLVPGNSPVQHVADLEGKGICFKIAGTAEQGISAYLGAPGAKWFAHPYSENGEMDDAYAVRHCDAMADEATALGRVRLLDLPGRLQSRFLPEPITVFPIIAATPAAADGQWAAIVAWTVYTLINAERAETEWFAGGARAMPVAAELGLSADWQVRVLKATGHYGDIFDRNLGAASPYRLERGFNANQQRGGLLLAPFVE